MNTMTKAAIAALCTDRDGKVGTPVLDGEPMTKLQILLSAKNIAKATRKCLLCHDRSAGLGVFFPDKPLEFAPRGSAYVPGKIRKLFYGLCATHSNLPVSERCEQVEVALKRKCDEEE